MTGLHYHVREIAGFTNMADVEVRVFKIRRSNQTPREAAEVHLMEGRAWCTAPDCGGRTRRVSRCCAHARGVERWLASPGRK